jgi:ubiquinone biosynthesis protein COQ9
MSTLEQAPSRGAGKRRGPYAKTEEKRRVILDAALEVFAKSGYRSGSIRDIADRVGMSEAGLLHHFPNKSALLAAVLPLLLQLLANHGVVPSGALGTTPREQLVPDVQADADGPLS